MPAKARDHPRVDRVAHQRRTCRRSPARCGRSPRTPMRHESPIAYWANRVVSSPPQKSPTPAAWTKSVSSASTGSRASFAREHGAGDQQDPRRARTARRPSTPRTGFAGHTADPRSSRCGGTARTRAVPRRGPEDAQERERPAGHQNGRSATVAGEPPTGTSSPGARLATHERQRDRAMGGGDAGRARRCPPPSRRAGSGRRARPARSGAARAGGGSACPCSAAGRPSPGPRSSPW